MVWSAFFDTTVMAWRRSSGWTYLRTFRRKPWRTTKRVRVRVGTLWALGLSVSHHISLFWASLFFSVSKLLSTSLFPCRSAVWAREVLGLLEIFQSQKFGYWPQTSRIPRQIPTSRRLPSGCEWMSLIFPTLIVLERKLDQRSGYLGFDPSWATSPGTPLVPIWALSFLNRRCEKWAVKASWRVCDCSSLPFP